MGDRVDWAAARAVPIGEVLGWYGIATRGRGPEVKALCPFHDDVRHPSLCVNLEEGLAWCATCGWGGDTIDFVAARECGQIDGPARVAAARILLARSPLGGAPPPPRPAAPKRRRPRGIVGPHERRALDAAVAAYHRRLLDEPQILQRCYDRGLGEDLIRDHRIGYCRGDELLPALARAGVAPYHAWNAGLLGAARDGGGWRHWERQAGRLTLPTRRDDGEFGWLTGRWLGPARLVGEGGEVRYPPKYLHLPGEHPLFGLDAETRRAPATFVVEGYLCRALLRSWGYPAVATFGTHLAGGAAEELRTLRGIYFLLDNDAGGRGAACRLAAGELAAVPCRTLSLPPFIALPGGATRPVKDVGDLAEALGPRRAREYFARWLAAELARPDGALAAAGGSLASPGVEPD